MKRKITVNGAEWFILDNGGISTDWLDTELSEFGDTRTLSWIRNNVDVTDILTLDNPSEFLAESLDNDGYTINKQFRI